MPILHPSRPVRSHEASARPPRGLAPDQVPQFVCLGFDDNALSGLEGSGAEGGMKWLLDFLRPLRNADGSPVRASFYVKAGILRQGGGFEDPRFARATFQQAMADGHEIGSHTTTHPHGVDVDYDLHTKRPLLDQAAWEAEMAESVALLDSLADPRQGIAAPMIRGFRTPYLQYNAASFPAIQAMGFSYDSSIEENWQPEIDGTSCLWPYTLHKASPGERWSSEVLYKIPSHSGGYPDLWELPISAHFAPPDELCPGYGVRPGLRKRLEADCSYYDPKGAKMTGLDWNFWFEFLLRKEEFSAVLKYTLDLRLGSNRAPLIWGGHSDIYSSAYDSLEMDDYQRRSCRASVKERREALEDFVLWAIARPEVRIVPMASLMDWMVGN